MDQNSFIGQRCGNVFIAVGRIHKLSKNSFSFEGFDTPIELEYPINQKDWDKKRSKVHGRSWTRQGVKNGKTTTFGAARRAVVAYCPVPKKMQRTTSRVDQSFPDDIFGDMLFDRKTDPSSEIAILGIATAMSSIGGKIR